MPTKQATKRATGSRKTTANKKSTTHKKTTTTTRAKKNSSSTRKFTLKANSDLSGQIRERAYHLYLERGCYHGDDMNDWLKAEKEVKKEYSLA